MVPKKVVGVSKPFICVPNLIYFSVEKASRSNNDDLDLEESVSSVVSKLAERPELLFNIYPNSCSVHILHSFDIVVSQ